MISESGSLWEMTRRSRVTTFIGAGGKTTCLQTLTQDIESAGLEVVATTTTKVYPEEIMCSWRNHHSPPREKGAWFWYDRVEDESGKWIGPSVTAVDQAITEDRHLDDMRYWVIEGDGARGLKLKCWEPYEPQIPKNTDCGVLVIDKELWGNVLQADLVHRPYLCQDLLGEIWESENAWSYFLRSPVFASHYLQMSWVILFNSPEKTFSLDLLHDLWLRWITLKENSKASEKKPSHLRLAAGDAKRGDLRWLDLW